LRVTDKEDVALIQQLATEYTNARLARMRAYRGCVEGLIHFSQYYGVSKILKSILFFNYRMLKRSLLNLTEEHVIEVNGCRLSTIPNDHGISAELLVFKTHEPLTTKLLKKELKKGMICLDIGANIGYYALLERKIVGSEGRVIAVEPSPLNFSYLKKNLRQNGFNDVEAFKFALSDSNGQVLFLIAMNSNWSRVVDVKDPSLEGAIINVPARSLDSFMTQYHLDKLDFLRMDVEGHEIKIFNGGRRTIENFRPILLLEIHEDLIGLKETVSFLQSLKSFGYNVSYFIPRSLDMPFIGSMNDVQEIDISHLIEKLTEGLLPACFHLLLANTQVGIA